MDPAIWLAFVAAAITMLVIPGPTIMLVIGQSLGGGARNALPLVAGVALGDLTAMTLSLAGLGALLAASATAFTALKWAGAAFLLYLGVKLWRCTVFQVQLALGPSTAWPFVLHWASRAVRGALRSVPQGVLFPALRPRDCR